MANGTFSTRARLARSAGLIGGSRLGARFGHVEDKVRKYIGLGILSQAGVAIGLSLIVWHDARRFIGRSEVAAAVADFAERNPDVSATSKIIKVVSAYDQAVHELKLLPIDAVEQLHRGSAYEFDPEVTSSLRRVLEFRGEIPQA